MMNIPAPRPANRLFQLAGLMALCALLSLLWIESRTWDDLSDRSRMDWLIPGIMLLHLGANLLQHLQYVREILYIVSMVLLVLLGITEANNLL